NPFPAFKGYRWGDQQKPFPEKLLQSQASVTDGQGRAIQAFKTNDLGGSDQPLLALYTASVFEPGGRPVAAPKVHYKLIAERWNYDWYEQGGRWSWRRTNRDAPVAEGMVDVGANA